MYSRFLVTIQALCPLAALFFGSAIIAQPVATPSQESRQKPTEDALAIPPDTTTERLLSELECKPVSTPVLGYACAALPAYEIGEWTHPELPSFASRYSQIQEKLHDEGFQVAIRGISDSRQPRGEKTWEDHVNGREVGGALCTKGQGTLTNEDYAWLRSCGLRNAIATVYGHPVTLLEPKAHSKMEKKYEAKHRAAQIFIFRLDWELQ